MKQNEKDTPKGKTIVNWTIGNSHFPEMGGNARAFFPTHNFDIIKHHREYVYKKFIVWEFANERIIKRVETTEEDFKECRKNWLNSELKELSHLIELPSMTRSDQIELGKYRDYINSELKINNKSSIKGNPKRTDPSEVRARAFCIALIQESGKMNFLNGKMLMRNKIMKFAKETWNLKGDGATVYREFIGMITRQNVIKDILKEDYPREYTRGMELYKELYPD